MSRHDLPLGRIAMGGAAIAATVLVVVILALLWIHERGLPAGGARAGRPYEIVIPGPALQSAPQSDFAAYRAEKHRLLHGLAWVDPVRGVARIPIDDAMALSVSASARAATAHTEAPPSAPAGAASAAKEGPQ
jgi:hypothetical protein